MINVIRGNGITISTKGILANSALGVASKGIIDVYGLNGCTTKVKTLATKGTLVCPSGNFGLALSTKGVLCCPIVVIEEIEEESPTIYSPGSWRRSQKSKKTEQKQYRKVKITVNCSGYTNTQVVSIRNDLDAKAQVLDIVQLDESPIIVHLKKII